MSDLRERPDESRPTVTTPDLEALRTAFTEADLAEWDAWRVREGNGGIMSLPEAYSLGCEVERERHRALVEAVRVVVEVKRYDPDGNSYVPPSILALRAALEALDEGTNA